MTAAAIASSPSQQPAANRILNFDIDTYLNPFVVPNPSRYLPRWISHWLGYRDADAYQGDKTCNVVRWAWAFIGAFCGIALIEGVYKSSSVIQSLSPPVIIGSFGAGAILEYNAIESPLSQPRNLILGQFLSATIGVAITKLFELLPEARFADLQWLAGALAVATTSLIMNITKTVHPPAGATALLAATDPVLRSLGWWLLPLDLIGSTLMLGSALVINNIQRRFPLYWWTPADLRKADKRANAKGDIETAAAAKAAPAPRLELPSTANSEKGAMQDNHSGKSSLFSDGSSTRWSKGDEDRIVITSKDIFIPDWLDVSDWRVEMMELLRQRLHEHEHEQ